MSNRKAFLVVKNYWQGARQVLVWTTYFNLLHVPTLFAVPINRASLKFLRTHYLEGLGPLSSVFFISEKAVQLLKLSVTKCVTVH